LYDWEVTEEPVGRWTAKLCGTKVVVERSEGGAQGVWLWEVHFADGQVQKGQGADFQEALDKGKRAAERFLS
jgi:hypothetical protein